jgi:hypothetical protein
MDKFYPGQYVVYKNGDRYERGRIKRIHPDGDKAWVWYHPGETAALTRFEDLMLESEAVFKHLINDYISRDNLGGEDARRMYGK